MTTADYTSFRAHLDERYPKKGLEQELLIHELGATLNRHSKISTDTSGFDRLNTAQLAHLLSHGNNIEAQHFIREALLLSAMIDGDLNTVDRAIDCHLIPARWGWLTEARAFTGDENAALRLLQATDRIREKCSLACLMARSRPECIGERFLLLFNKDRTSRALARLIDIALDREDPTAIADFVLRWFKGIAVHLLDGHLDHILYRTVRHCREQNPHVVLAPHPMAIGERTRLALAEHAIRSQDYKRAVDYASGTRLLSQTFPRMAIIGTLALIEARSWDQALQASEHIEDLTTRLQCQVRIAQATGNTELELARLVDLHERDNSDPATFMQLLQCLDRLGQQDLARELSLKNQEQFLDQPEVMQVLQAYIA